MPLSQLLTSLKTRLHATKDTIGAAPGPLADPQRTAVADNLDRALDEIAASLLEINDEGAADPTLPDTLADIAELCCDLADDALDRVQGQQDSALIGNDLKT